MSSRQKKRIDDYLQANAASLPNFIPVNCQMPALLEHRAAVIWAPTSQLSDAVIEQYVNTAASEHNIEEEQALYILRKQHYDLQLALTELSSTQTARVCRYHRWKAHDLICLTKAFEQHGDDFEQVHKLMPHFPKAELRQYFRFVFCS